MKFLNILVISVTVLKPLTIRAMSYDYIYNNERRYYNYMPSTGLTATTTNKNFPTSGAVFGVKVNENEILETNPVTVRVQPKRLVYCLCTISQFRIILMRVQVWFFVNYQLSIITHSFAVTIYKKLTEAMMQPSAIRMILTFTVLIVLRTPRNQKQMAKH